MTTGYTPYFIGPVNVGLERDLDSYLIPDDAFVDLDNAYVRRGRVYKKGGYRVLGQGPKAGRLGVRTIQIAVRTGGADVYNLTISASANDRPIEPGSLIITDGTTTFTDDGMGGFTIVGAGVVNGPTNYATSAINITFTAGNAGALVTANYIVVVNDNSPCMGLRNYDLANSIFAGLVAFDLTSAYQFNNVTFQFDNTRFYKSISVAPGVSNVVSWTGSNTDFFDSENYQGAMFATNNVAGTNFYLITNLVSVAMTTQVTTSVANNFAPGDIVYFNNVTGFLDAAGKSTVNNKTATVTIAGNPFTCDLDTSTAVTVYGANSGIAWELNKTKVGGGDGIRWYDGFTPGLAPATGWVNFEPPLADPTIKRPRILSGALLIFAYKDRLVCLNTQETDTNTGVTTTFSQRARWSQVGNVFFSNPLPGTTAFANISVKGTEWIDNLPGNGGFRDAPTGQEIVGAELIKDTLVVYFEASTYKLTFIGDSVTPFIWEKVNTEIGANSTFSVVPFDRQILSVGPNGVYACDSVSMERIDRIIPDEVFTFTTASNNAKRIQGIRDFYAETVQWTFLDVDENSITKFPYKSLLYNYVNQTFAIFFNSFTAFGHFNSFFALTWETAIQPWSFYNAAWDSFINQTGFPIVVAGNQQGFVFQLQNSSGEEVAFTDRSLSIQSITAGPPSVFTVHNHNLQPNDIIVFDGTLLTTLPENYAVVLDANYTQHTFSIQDSNGNYVSTAGYVYGGLIEVIDNFVIGTKNLNPFFAQGKSMRLGYADFFLDTTEATPGIPAASISVYLYQNDDAVNPVEQHTLSTQNLYITQNSKAWFRVYFQSQGQFLKIQLSLSDNFADQPDDAPAGLVFDENNTKYPLVLHGMILWMKPTGRDIYVP